MKTKLLILGAGPGGYVAAIRAGRLGMNPILVEKHKIGGVCLNYGCIPTKALLSKTALLSAIKKGKRYGLSVDNARLDYARLSSYKDRLVSGLVKGIQTLLEDSGVQTVQDAGIFKNEHQLELASGELIEFENAIIATGSRNRDLPGISVDNKYVLDSTSALALGEVPGSILVIGAGAIGLELGLIFARLETKVTVVEVMNEILPGMDAELAGMLRNTLSKEGMKFKLNNSVEKIDITDNGIEAYLSDSDESQTFDKALMSVGRLPNTECIGSLDIEQLPGGYLEVDETLSTSIPSIKAIGDVAGLPLLAHKASHQGLMAVEIIAGHRAAAEGLECIPGAVFTEPEFASVGITGLQAKKRGIKAHETMFPLSAVSRAKTLDAAVGGFKIVHDDDGKVLGVHILSPDAGDMISEATLAISKGLKVDDIAESVHVHPTLSEGLMEAALLADNRRIHI